MYSVTTILFLKKKFLEDMSPFCGATDTPVLDFWRCLSWVSKPGWIPRLHAFTCMQWIPEIHLWCDMCWPLGSQHGSRSHSLHACSRGRMPGFDRETSRTVSRHAVHSATATGCLIYWKTGESLFIWLTTCFKAIDISVQRFSVVKRKDHIKECKGQLNRS